MLFRSGIIKPDVVLYEEGLDDSTVTGAVNAISKADTLIIAGTSVSYLTSVLRSVCHYIFHVLLGPVDDVFHERQEGEKE